MKNYFSGLRPPLFDGIEPENLEAMLTCLSPRVESFRRGDILLRPGETTEEVGMVLTGKLCVSKEDFWGNRNILTMAEPGDAFAEAYACAPPAPVTVTVSAEEPGEVMFLRVRRILTVCSSACAFHSRLIRNLLTLLAARNLAMNEKLTHLTQRSTREKLLSYLSAEAQKREESEFVIPYNRQQLADYLSVDRSALSAELSRLRKEGILDCDRSRFTLRRQEPR